MIPGHRNLENVCTSKMVESWQKGLSRAELEANEFSVELLLPSRFCAVACTRYDFGQYAGA
jgi:hypothetical protein